MTRQLDLTVQGVVGTHPVLSRVGNRQRSYCRFRVAVTPTYRTQEGWQDGETMWFTAKAWGQLAENISRSLHKGDPVLMTGRLSEDTWKTDAGMRSSNVIVLHSAGHDLTRGETRFVRIKPLEDGAEIEVEAGSGTQGEGAVEGVAGLGSAGSPGSAPSAGSVGTVGVAGGESESVPPFANPAQLPADHWESSAGEPLDATGVTQASTAVQAYPDEPVAQPAHRSADYEVVPELTPVPEPVL